MPAGRIILKSISDSKKVSMLKTDGARLLYTWLITHLDINGCYSGDAQVINGKVFTRLNKSVKTIEEYLLDMENVGLVLRYKDNGDVFLNVPDFVEKQPALNPNKEAKPTIPVPSPELLQTYSGETLPQVKESKVKESKIYSSDLQADTEPKIVFNHLSEKWENIQDKHIDNWIKAYPACDIPTELARMKQWILANGAKGHKSNWLKFIINWLSRTQDRGGSFKN